MLKKYLPAYRWMKNYQKQDLAGDLSAGFIVAIMLIPQGMAYAMLAGLPPVIGLYASTIPLIIYALFGTSRHLAVGPVAMVSLLVYSGVSTIATPNTSEYISLVLLLMLMIGMIQFLLGFFRLGFLVNYLSDAVISGFTSAAAIIIALSQVKNLLGLSIESNQIFLVILEILRKVKEINILAVALGISSILFLVLSKKYAKRIPGPLLVVGLSILLVNFFQLQNYGLEIVGDLPKGLPKISIPAFSMESIKALLPIALTISFIGFMESIAMAKVIARREKYKIEPNRELIGLGLANLIGSFFSALPVTGGFSRSAVNYQAGARTPLATIVTAILVLFSLLFFTSLFYYLPQAVLAAIIIVAVYSLIDFKEARFLFSVNKLDGFTWLVTFLATLLIGIEKGILIGLGFSLLSLLAQTAHPHMKELGLLRGQNIYVNIKEHKEVLTYEKILILGIGASLNFVNIGEVTDKICQRIAKQEQIEGLILDLSGVNKMDTFALRGLKDFINQCQNQGRIKLIFTGVKADVMDQLKKAKILGFYEGQNYYLTIKAAVDALQAAKE